MASIDEKLSSIGQVSIGECEDQAVTVLSLLFPVLGAPPGLPVSIQPPQQPISSLAPVHTMPGKLGSNPLALYIGSYANIF